jgi:hypothetical protein
MGALAFLAALHIMTEAAVLRLWVFFLLRLFRLREFPYHLHLTALPSSAAAFISAP